MAGIANNFMGKEGQTVPVMDDDMGRDDQQKVYPELYEKVIGGGFPAAAVDGRGDLISGYCILLGKFLREGGNGEGRTGEGRSLVTRTFRKRKGEGAAFTGFTLDVHMAAVAGKKFLAQHQSQAGAGFAARSPGRIIILAHQSFQPFLADACTGILHGRSRCRNAAPLLRRR